MDKREGSCWKYLKLKEKVAYTRDRILCTHYKLLLWVVCKSTWDRIVRSKENSLANGIVKLRQTAEHNGRAIHSQGQMVTRERLRKAKLGSKDLTSQGNLTSPGLGSLQITSRSQLYFSSRPRKAAKPGGQLQDRWQWLKTSQWSIIRDHNPKRSHLENWWIFCWNPPLRAPLRFQPAGER